MDNKTKFGVVGGIVFTLGNLFGCATTNTQGDLELKLNSAGMQHGANTEQVVENQEDAQYNVPGEQVPIETEISVSEQVKELSATGNRHDAHKAHRLSMEHVSQLVSEGNYDAAHSFTSEVKDSVGDYHLLGTIAKSQVREGKMDDFEETLSKVRQDYEKMAEDKPGLDVDLNINSFLKNTIHSLLEDRDADVEKAYQIVIDHGTDDNAKESLMGSIALRLADTCNFDGAMDMLQRRTDFLENDYHGLNSSDYFERLTNNLYQEVAVVQVASGRKEDALKTTELITDEEDKLVTIQYINTPSRHTRTQRCGYEL
jgi:hypothetical protein